MKRWVVNLAHAVFCAALASGAGCATSLRTGPSAGDSSIPASRSDFAEALAQYSTGISHEWNEREGESFSNFLRAAELDPDNEELHFRVALLLVQQQRPAEAVALMQGLAKRHPKSERAQLWLALICHASGELDQALATYDRVLKLNPRSTVPYLQKTELLLRQKRYLEAMDNLSAGLVKVEQPLDLYQALGPLELGHARMERAAGRATKRLPRAISRFEQAVERYPDDHNLRELLGRLYIMNGQISQALDTYAPLEKAGPDDLRKFQQLAGSFLLAPDRRDTLEALAERAAQEPPNARVLVYLGTVLEQSTLPNEAAEAYRRAIEADPNWPASYLRRVVLQVADQEPEEAILTLEDGLMQMPGEVRFLELLAYIQLGRRAYPDALDAFARANDAIEAQKKEPVSSSFHLSYAFAHQVEGQIDQAAQRLRKAMEVNPVYLDAYVQYIFRSGNTSHLAGCAQVLESLAQVSNITASVWAYQGLLHNFNEEYASAIKAFEQTEKTARAQEEAEEVLSPTFYFWFGSACERAGQFDRAVALFSRVLETKPEAGRAADFKAYVDALNYMAYMHAERGLELERSLRQVNEALAIRPDSAAFIDTRGWIYYMQGRYEEAHAEIQRAIALLPGDPTLAEHMGDVLAKLGNQEEAITWWKAAFHLDPSNEKLGAKLTGQGVDLAPLREKAAAEKEAQASEANGQEMESSLPDFGVEETDILSPGEDLDLPEGEPVAP